MIAYRWKVRKSLKSGFSRGFPFPTLKIKYDLVSLVTILEILLQLLKIKDTVYLLSNGSYSLGLPRALDDKGFKRSFGSPRHVIKAYSFLQ